ncbi:MAG: translation initiation factor eIF-2B [Patescibacteria group bacterium]|nr:translation initiation factor eIF-2B [Patescibacteria group bacterium]MDD4304880.1 translation initiation factor eIF-2B [Patescibacteria group bacterium]MDD4695781.1 translation initiation factor eIF-2B [Patescibacteria group bacterium]
MNSKNLDKIKKIIKDIKDIKIQGATNISIATIEILKLLAIEYKNLNINSFINKIEKTGTKMALLRKTEPMTQNAIKYVIYNIKKANPKTTNETINNINKYCDEFIKLIKSNDEKLIKNGITITNTNNRILTHCHSSSVEKILINSKSKNIEVFNTETRPLFQGRIMAENLTKAGIKTTMLVDSAADFFISKHSGKLMMDKVIIGCDSISWNGGIVNKIGSYGISLSCKHNKTPLYIAGNLLKMDSDNIINIEIREDSEVWHKKGNKFDIINIAFDFVPAEFITGIICEFGIIKPKEVKNIVQSNYPWLMNKK